MKRAILIIIGFLATVSCRILERKDINKAPYVIESITTPHGLTAEVAALDFFPDGRLAAAFMRGEIMIYHPKTNEWKPFAVGLHEPLGMHVVNDNEVLVMQLPELTRVKDTNGDGLADVYETVYDGFGMTSNYHEFTYGPVKDKKGNLYFALNAASSGGGIAKEVRGELNMDGKGKQKGMFSVVPYRGWVMKLTPEGKIIPFASGFRSPNGLAIDQNDNLFVTDNQGDWVGSSPLHHVQEGKFYGQPSSLVWDKNWKRGNPFEWSVDSLNNLRERPAVIFPHDVLANSPSQPISITDNMNLAPFKGQLLVGEMNQGRILRIMLEDVNGTIQGAATTFIDGNGLRKGNNRLAIAPDGTLWVGQTDHGWLGDRGIQKITFSGNIPLDVKDIKLTEQGFELSFTKAISAGRQINLASLVSVKRYNYHYHAKYGSKPINLKELAIKTLKTTSGNKKMLLEFEDGIEEGFVYEIKINGLQSKNMADTLSNKIIAYTVNKRR